MSQSSELEEGEFPKSVELSPIIKDADDNNHHHKMYSRGVAALLGGICDEPVKPSEQSPKPQQKESPKKLTPISQPDISASTRFSIFANSFNHV